MTEEQKYDRQIREAAADLVESVQTELEVSAIIAAAALLMGAGVLDKTAPGFAREHMVRALIAEFEGNVRHIISISTAPDAA